MIICSCNSLSDKDVDAAVQGGVHRLSQVYASRQCRVKCGQCVPNVACRLKAALRAQCTERSVASEVATKVPYFAETQVQKLSIESKNPIQKQ